MIAGLTLPLAIVAICYKKCRVATNIRHCKVVQKLHICKKVYFDQLLDYNIAFIIPSHFIIVPYLTL